MKKIYAGFLGASLILLAHSPIKAQAVLSRSIFGSGGIQATNGTMALNGTLGQPVTGFSGGVRFNHSAGFWNSPDFPTSAEWGLEDLPHTFALSQNYPNPFNPATTIEYALPHDSHVTLEVFNILGQKVATVLDEPKKAGNHKVTWNASGIPAGLFFYRLEAGNVLITKKLILLK